MNLFEKIVFALKAEMVEPEPFGWFHLSCLAIMVACIVFLYTKKKDFGEHQMKTVVGTYGFIALALEVLKQIVWSFNYDSALNLVTWDYQWYAAPFQFCTMPIYASLLIFFMKDCKIRRALMSFLAFTTILGSMAVIVMPESCFVGTILVNVHTTWLHYGSFVVSIYLMMSGMVEFNPKSLQHATLVFGVCLMAAMVLNIGVYHSGVLGDNEVFNMFHISPYFISILPVFSTLQQNAPYVIYLMCYIAAVSLGTTIIWFIAKETKWLIEHRSTRLHMARTM